LFEILPESHQYQNPFVKRYHIPTDGWGVPRGKSLAGNQELH